MTFIKAIRNHYRTAIGTDPATTELRLEKKFKKDLELIINHQSLHMITITNSCKRGKVKQNKIQRKKRTARKKTKNIDLESAVLLCKL